MGEKKTCRCSFRYQLGRLCGDSFGNLSKSASIRLVEVSWSVYIPFQSRLKPRAVSMTTQKKKGVSLTKTGLWKSVLTCCTGCSSAPDPDPQLEQLLKQKNAKKGSRSSARPGWVWTHVELFALCCDMHFSVPDLHKLNSLQLHFELPFIHVYMSLASLAPFTLKRVFGWWYWCPRFRLKPPVTVRASFLSESIDEPTSHLSKLVSDTFCTSWLSFALAFGFLLPRSRTRDVALKNVAFPEGRTEDMIDGCLG